MRVDWRRFRKVIGGVLGGATGTGVASVLLALGVHVPAPAAAALAAVLAAVGTAWAKPNSDRNAAGIRPDEQRPN